MKTNPTTVEAYLRSLPDDRREALSAVRKVILKNLPLGYVETMDFGMIAYVVPLERFPKTYNGHPLMLAALASQKNHMSLYLMNVYGDPGTERWFTQAFANSGKRLDMGKSCIRFRKLDDLPLDVIGKAIARTPVDDYVAVVEKARQPTRSKK